MLCYAVWALSKYLRHEITQFGLKIEIEIELIWLRSLWNWDVHFCSMQNECWRNVAFNVSHLFIARSMFEVKWFSLSGQYTGIWISIWMPKYPNSCTIAAKEHRQTLATIINCDLIIGRYFFFSWRWHSMGTTYFFFWGDGISCRPIDKKRYITFYLIFTMSNPIRGEGFAANRSMNHISQCFLFDRHRFAFFLSFSHSLPVRCAVPHLFDLTLSCLLVLLF